jgi:calcium-dependent protein kinase
MLCGYPPFNGANDTEILKKVKEGRYELPAREWSKISDDAKDFVSKMLNKDPRRRVTAEVAFTHPWLLNMAPKHGDLDQVGLQTLTNLQNFRTEQKLQSAVLTFIASQLVN